MTYQRTRRAFAGEQPPGRSDSPFAPRPFAAKPQPQVRRPLPPPQGAPETLQPRESEAPEAEISPDGQPEPGFTISHGSPDGTVVQPKVAPLTAEQIQAIEQHEDNAFDAEYLDNLYVDSTGRLYLYAGYIAKKNVDSAARPEVKMHLYVRVEKFQEENLDATLGDVNNLVFVSEDEANLLTGRALYLILSQKFSADFAEATLNNLVARAMRGEPKQGAGGEFSNVEFRFQANEGLLVTWRAAFARLRMPGIETMLVSREDFNLLVAAYAEYDLPFPTERIGDYAILFTDASIDQLPPFGEGKTDEFADIQIKDDVEPPGPAPGGAKHQEARYTRPATRGSRAQGQKAAMANTSAKDYVRYFIGGRANATSWEWLHLKGSRLGGRNQPENLVAGTFSANSQMIPYEREILKLSQEASPERPVRVDFDATVRTAGDQSTHIGNQITITVSIPNGTRSNHTARNFVLSFDATEANDFTKLDRDAAVGWVGQLGARQHD